MEREILKFIAGYDQVRYEIIVDKFDLLDKNDILKICKALEKKAISKKQ